MELECDKAGTEARQSDSEILIIALRYLLPPEPLVKVPLLCPSTPSMSSQH